jgi:hypothetical protein
MPTQLAWCHNTILTSSLWLPALPASSHSSPSALPGPHGTELKPGICLQVAFIYGCFTLRILFRMNGIVTKAGSKPILTLCIIICRIPDFNPAVNLTHHAHTQTIIYIIRAWHIFSPCRRIDHDAIQILRLSYFKGVPIPKYPSCSS